MKLVDRYSQLSQKQRNMLANGLVALVVIVVIGLVAMIGFIFMEYWCEPCKAIKLLGG